MSDGLERARIYGEQGRERTLRELEEIRKLKGRLCADCVRTATTWRRDAKGHWRGRCRIHGARTGVERKKATLDETLRRGR
jgi:hypothetical protein